MTTPSPLRNHGRVHPHHHVAAHGARAKPGGKDERGGLLVHREGVAIHPEEIQRQVAQEFVPAGVFPLAQPGDDVRLGGGLLLEIPLDDGRKLLQRVEDREVQLGEEVKGENDATVAIRTKGLCMTPLPLG